MIDGKPRTIPPAGVDFNTTSGAGVVASANNYLVAFWDVTTDPANPRIGLKAVQTARTVHTTLGYPTCGNNAETLVAGFYAESDKFVYYTQQRKNFATWYGKKPRAISGPTGGNVTAGGLGSGGSFTELYPPARCYAYMWAGIAVDISASGDCNPSTYDNEHIAVSLSGDQSDQYLAYVQGTMPQSYVFPGTARLVCEPSVDGLQYVAIMGKVNNSTAVFNRMRTTALVHI